MVVEVAWVNGLAAIRSLGRQGLRVLAVDHRPGALGLRSRYAEARLAPDPLDDEDGFIEALRAIAEETDNVLTIPDYREDRAPSPEKSSLHFGGGLGTAAVLDVAAHPIRARARQINPLTVMAITVIVGVALVMLTMVVTFKY